jgi:hypothetical protein
MTKIGRLNVDLTANTRGFDVAMRNARSQLRELRKASAPGLGAMGAGGLGQMMGVMSMASPMAAIGAATMAISSFAAQMAADRARGANNLSEILVQGMSIPEQARFSSLSRAVTGQDSAIPAREAMRAVQSMDWRTMADAIGRGVERSTIDSLKSITDPVVFFRELQAAQARSPGLAAAVGGKAGEFISRMSILDPARFAEMSDIDGSGRSARQTFMAAAEANRPLSDEPSFRDAWPKLSGFLEAILNFGRTEMGGGTPFDPALVNRLYGALDRMGGGTPFDPALVNRLYGTLDSIDRKIAGAAQ